jgi:hypothetical protein
MEQLSRHRCFVYQGAPSSSLHPISRAIAEKLQAGFRCMFLHSVPMVAGMRSYLSALDVDVEAELRRGSLVLVSERYHLIDGVFSMETMLAGLEEALQQSLMDGFVGLFAAGDMTWEFGSEKNLDKLVTYEWQLEQFFRTHPQLSGVCMYHSDTLPPQAIRQGVMVHPSIFVNETLSIVNPRFVHPVYAPGHGEEAMEY